VGGIVRYRVVVKGTSYYNCVLFSAKPGSGTYPNWKNAPIFKGAC